MSHVCLNISHSRPSIYTKQYRLTPSPQCDPMGQSSLMPSHIRDLGVPAVGAIFHHTLRYPVHGLAHQGLIDSRCSRAAKKDSTCILGLALTHSALVRSATEEREGKAHGWSASSSAQDQSAFKVSFLVAASNLKLQAVGNRGGPVSPLAPRTQLYHDGSPANGVVSCVMLMGNWNPGLPVTRMISK